MEHKQIVNLIIDELNEINIEFKHIDYNQEKSEIIGEVTNVIFSTDVIEFKITYMNNSRIVNSRITKIPYKDVTDYISVSKFLNKKLNNFNTNEFSLDHYSGVDEDKLRSLLKNFSKRIQESLMPILMGKDWDSNSFTDWTTNN